MVEFKVQLEEDIVNQYGKNNLEKYLQDYLSKAILSLAAKDILEELESLNIDKNDIETGREKAWDNYGKHYFLNVIASA